MKNVIGTKVISCFFMYMKKKLKNVFSVIH